jgi:hypothetical protein
MEHFVFYCDHLVYLVANCLILWHVGIFLAICDYVCILVVPMSRKIWQPSKDEEGFLCKKSEKSSSFLNIRFF